MFVFFCQPYRARELKELKCLCADDEKTLMSWIMAVRLAKVMLVSLISIHAPRGGLPYETDGDACLLA